MDFPFVWAEAHGHHAVVRSPRHVGLDIVHDAKLSGHVLETALARLLRARPAPKAREMSFSGGLRVKL